MNKVSIQKYKLINGVAILVLTISVGFGVFTFKSLESKMIGELKKEHSDVLALSNLMFVKELTDIRQSSYLIFNHIKDITDTESEHFLKTLEASLLAVSPLLPTVSQLRVLDQSGLEVIRLNVNNEKAVFAQQHELQNKSKRDYYVNALGLVQDEVYLSKLDLNMENGKVVMPLEPTIRAVYKWRVNDDYYIVINFKLTDLYHTLKTLHTDYTDLMVSFNFDYYVTHPVDSKEWSSMLATKGTSLLSEFPSLSTQFDTDRSLFFETLNTGGVISASSLEIEQSKNTSTGRFNELTFIAHTNKARYTLLYQPIYIISFMIVTICLILCGYIGYVEIKKQRQLASMNAALLREKQALSNSLENERVLKDELVESEKMASLGYLVAGVAHEINTPLGASKMTISNVLSRNKQFLDGLPNGITKQQLEELITNNIASVEHATSNLAKAADIIKRFKRLAVDRNSEVRSKFDVVNTVKDVVESMAPIFSKHQIKVELQLPSPTIVFSYAGIYSQLIQNLLMNCVDHAFNYTTNKHITIIVTDDEMNVYLTVLDNGSGISTGDKSPLEPFYTTARNKGNTGLGLHLVYTWLTQLLNGKIKIDTRDNGGTIVSTQIAKNNRVGRNRLPLNDLTG